MPLIYEEDENETDSDGADTAETVGCESAEDAGHLNAQSDSVAVRGIPVEWVSSGRREVRNDIDNSECVSDVQGGVVKSESRECQHSNLVESTTTNVFGGFRGIVELGSKERQHSNPEASKTTSVADGGDVVDRHSYDLEVRNDLANSEGNSVDVSTAVDSDSKERQHSNPEDSRTTVASDEELATKNEDIDFVPRPIRHRRRPAMFEDFDVQYVCVMRGVHIHSMPYETQSDSERMSTRRSSSSSEDSQEDRLIIDTRSPSQKSDDH